jgi:hypothetical protein
MLHRAVSYKFTDVSELLTAFYHLGDRSDDGGSKHVRNIGQFLVNHMTQQRSRQSSSNSLPQQTEI